MVNYTKNKIKNKTKTINIRVEFHWRKLFSLYSYGIWQKKKNNSNRTHKQNKKTKQRTLKNTVLSIEVMNFQIILCGGCVKFHLFDGNTEKDKRFKFKMQQIQSCSA